MSVGMINGMPGVFGGGPQPSVQKGKLEEISIGMYNSGNPENMELLVDDKGNPILDKNGQKQYLDKTDPNYNDIKAKLENKHYAAQTAMAKNQAGQVTGVVEEKSAKVGQLKEVKAGVKEVGVFAEWGSHGAAAEH